MSANDSLVGADEVVQTRLALPGVFWLFWLAGIGGIGYAAWTLFNGGHPRYGWVASGGVVIWLLFSGLAWRIGDLVRRFAAPSLYAANGFQDLIVKRIFWSIGPQVVALFVLLFLMLWGMMSIGEHYGWEKI